MRKNAFRWASGSYRDRFRRRSFALPASRVRVIWLSPPLSFPRGDDAGLPAGAFRQSAVGSNRARALSLWVQRFKSSKGLFHVLIALHDFELIAVVKFQRCLQSKEMLLAVIALQGFGNLLRAALDLGMPHLGQLDAVAFPGKDSAQNAHSRHPGNVTDDPVNLDIHLREGLLHALHQTVAILA